MQSVKTYPRALLFSSLFLLSYIVTLWIIRYGVITDPLAFLKTRDGQPSLLLRMFEAGDITQGLMLFFGFFGIVALIGTALMAWVVYRYIQNPEHFEWSALPRWILWGVLGGAFNSLLVSQAPFVKTLEQIISVFSIFVTYWLVFKLIPIGSSAYVRNEP